ncbi:MAG: S1 RNA-binding domain-containing protein [Myxococcales bacterium]|nr:S1 RNA-binding domain-containing protein [Myxococcales bacterium]
MLAAYESENAAPQRKRPKPGDAVSGRIVSIGQESVFVDLGGKSEGSLSVLEVRDPETGKLTVAVGDTIEATVVESEDGGLVLRRKLGRGKQAHRELAQAFEHGIPVEGLVGAVNRGGVEVTIAGARAFCPISQLDLRHTEDATPFVGQRLSFRITRFEEDDRGRTNIVVSRRSLLEEEARGRAEVTRARLHVGAVMAGIVTTLKDYGAFIDLGGLEGMLHVSEIGFARVGKPSEVLSVGQGVQVQILKIEKSGDPKRPEKIALSLKSLEKDPWDEIVAGFPEGSRRRGKVMRIEQFGAFIELAPGIEGLAHISELGGGKQVKHARQVVKVGEAVEVTVLGVDRDKRRISLALAAAAEEGDSDGDAPPIASPPTTGFGTFGDLLRKGKK